MIEYYLAVFGSAALAALGITALVSWAHQNPHAFDDFINKLK